MKFPVAVVAATVVLALMLNGGSADAKIWQIQFNNFDQTVVLEAKGDGFSPEGDANHKPLFHLSPRLIVKTAPHFEKHLFSELNVGLAATSLLYEGRSFRYFLLELSTTHSLGEALALLGRWPEVLLVQPDMLQLKAVVDSHQSPQKTARAIRPTAKSTISSTSLKPTTLPKGSQALPITSGQGVRIAVIDDGFDFNHPEFAQLKLAFQYDTEFKTLDARPKHPLDTHGTKIAGILFAQRDGKGVEGVVPDASLIAIRQPNTWTSQTLLAFQLARLTQADLINCSWHSQWLLQPVHDVVQDLALHGRGGQGVAVVFAAGNQGLQLKPGQHEATIPEAIVVGASRLSGEPAYYSNRGAQVDTFAVGASRQTTANQGGFTAISGTSLAAAEVSGYIARMLNKNPQLTLQQIENQLATLSQGQQQ